MMKIFKKAAIYIIGVVVIGLAVGQLTMLIKTLTQSSRIVGSFEYEKTELIEVAGYDFGMFVPFANSMYSVEFEPIVFDAQRNDYRVIVNGRPVDLLKHQGGLIEAQNVMRFYDVDGALSAVFALTIRFEFRSSKTTLTLSASGDGLALQYFNQFTENEGLKIQVFYDQKITITEGKK